MATPSYVPVRGEIVWIYSRSGKGTYLPSGRPAVTVSPEAYNRRAGLALFCPITDEEKGYPFEVAIPAGLPATGIILADQLESVDWRSGTVVRICALPAEVMDDVLRKAAALLDDEDRS